jgi:hypothetical protein
VILTNSPYLLGTCFSARRLTWERIAIQIKRTLVSRKSKMVKNLRRFCYAEVSVYLFRYKYVVLACFDFPCVCNHLPVHVESANHAIFND